jgi:Na+-driven multidrug efflux pump
MGAASMVSRSLGKKNYERASNVVGNSIIASFALGTFAAIMVFIFVLDMGIKGAAYATIIAQFTGFIYISIYYILGKSSLKIRMVHFRMRWRIFKEMVSLGFASFIRQVSMSFLIIVVNNSLRVYGGDIAIAVFSVVNRVVMFVTMPLFGIVAGVQPMIGFNYGANNMGRVKGSLKTSVLTTLTIGAVFFIIIMAIPSKILGLFSTDMELINSGVFPMRMISLLFPFIGFQMIGASFFQSIGKAKPSIVLSLSRQILFLIPLILLLPLTMGISGIWIAFPIADFLAILITGIFIYREIRKINKLELVPEKA